MKRPRDDLSHNVYSEDKKETLKIIRPSVDLQSGSLKVKESNAPHVDVYKSKFYRFVKVICGKPGCGKLSIELFIECRLPCKKIQNKLPIWVERARDGNCDCCNGTNVRNLKSITNYSIRQYQAIKPTAISFVARIKLMTQSLRMFWNE